MKTYEHIEAMLHGAVNNRKKKFADVLGNGGTINPLDDVGIVQGISVMCEVLEGYQYDAMTHRLTKDEPTAINVNSEVIRGCDLAVRSIRQKSKAERECFIADTSQSEQKL